MVGTPASESADVMAPSWPREISVAANSSLATSPRSADAGAGIRCSVRASACATTAPTRCARASWATLSQSDTLLAAGTSLSPPAATPTASTSRRSSGDGTSSSSGRSALVNRLTSSRRRCGREQPSIILPAAHRAKHYCRPWIGLPCLQPVREGRLPSTRP